MLYLRTLRRDALEGYHFATIKKLKKKKPWKQNENRHAPVLSKLLKRTEKRKPFSRGGLKERENVERATEWESETRESEDEKL